MPFQLAANYVQDRRVQRRVIGTSSHGTPQIRVMIETDACSPNERRTPSGQAHCGTDEAAKEAVASVLLSGP